MPFAIAALLQDYLEIMDTVLASLLSDMPDKGDMKSSQAGKALTRHGMWLEQVGRLYKRKEDIPIICYSNTIASSSFTSSSLTQRNKT